MSSNSVVPAKKPAISEISTVEPSVDRDEVRLAAARLRAAGFSRKQAALALKDHLSPTGNERSAYHKLRRWELGDPAFRDLMYEQAVIKLDLETADILKGVSSRAKRGRVDAARLALEVTGRHSPRQEQVVSNITVQIANVPRPGETV